MPKNTYIEIIILFGRGSVYGSDSKAALGWIWIIPMFINSCLTEAT